VQIVAGAWQLGHYGLPLSNWLLTQEWFQFSAESLKSIELWIAFSWIGSFILLLTLSFLAPIGPKTNASALNLFWDKYWRNFLANILLGYLVFTGLINPIGLWPEAASINDWLSVFIYAGRIFFPLCVFYYDQSFGIVFTVAKWSLGLVFIGYGIQAMTGLPEFQDFVLNFSQDMNLKLGETLARTLLFSVGLGAVMAGVLVLLNKVSTGMLYGMSFWAVSTSVYLFYNYGFYGLAPFCERLPHFVLPLIILSVPGHVYDASRVRQVSSRGSLFDPAFVIKDEEAWFIKRK